MVNVNVLEESDIQPYEKRRKIADVIGTIGGLTESAALGAGLGIVGARLLSLFGVNGTAAKICNGIIDVGAFAVAFSEIPNITDRCKIGARKFLSCDDATILDKIIRKQLNETVEHE